MNIDSKSIVEGRKKELRELLSSMEQVSPDDAISMVDAYIMTHEAGMFQEIGRITRTLHEALNVFQADSRIIELTKIEIPDAKERLNYVITMTEQSANKVLNAVEETMPISESLKDHAEALHNKWKLFCNREMNVQEFRKMSVEIDKFLSDTVSNATAIHANLSVVIMAQDYQDLTGQIIRRVITMVQDVEESMVKLVRITGQNMMQDMKQEKKNPENTSVDVSGPAVPGLVAPNQMTNQDEVDALLSSLGF